MSHEMYENDHALYVGKPAWHGLGTVIENAPTTMDAMRLAKMDFDVKLSEPIVATYDGYCSTHPSKFHATVRDDTQEVLGVVNKNYKIVQNKELFEIADALPNAKVETAGTLFNGAQSYVLMKDDEFAVNGNDEMHEYLCLMNSHNGTLSLSALPTSIRVVCNNTLSWAISEGTQRMIKLKHTGDMSDKILSLKGALEEWHSHKMDFRSTVQRLGRTRWKREEIQSFWMDCYQMFEGEVPKDSDTDDNHNLRKKAMATFHGWSDTFDKEVQQFGQDSAWIAANAVTNWLQHKKRRTTEATVANKLIGDASRDSTRVMRKALQLV
jgi:phage/plasmid-like protein (TIGR03299 family)